MIISLNVSIPIGCCESLTRKQKLPFVSVNLFITCLSVLLLLAVTGESILGGRLAS